jgi:antitoxin CptB
MTKRAQKRKRELKLSAVQLPSHAGVATLRVFACRDCMDLHTANIKRLRWRCRRGMRELDLMLEHFLLHRYSAVSTDLQHNFERLLGCEDDQLWDWLRGASLPADGALAEVVLEVRRHATN